MSKPMKRDAIEAFGDDGAAPPTSKKRPRRKDKGRRSKPSVAGQERTKHGSATPSKTSEAFNLKTEGLTTGSHPPPRHEPGKTDGDSKEPGRKKNRKRVESRPETSQSAGHSHSMIKTEAESEHEHHKIRNKKGKKLVGKSKAGRRNQKSRPPSEVSWDVAIQGGFFIDQDPLLSKDEQHLILPTKSHIHVYAAATSLLVRSLSIGLVNPVTSCTICPSDPEQILVSNLDGTITKYIWTTGKKMQQWKTRPGLLRIYGLQASESSGSPHRMLAINQSSEGERDLSQLTLPQSPDMLLEETVLCGKHRLSPTVVILDHGRLLLTFAGDKLMLGSTQGPMSADYKWHEFTVPGKIVSFDARCRQPTNQTTKNKSIVDVALGLQDGAILILEDITNKPTGKGKVDNGVDMVPRRLLWHRDLVASVKWSRDGNYLISGGRETVLVLWQLDTNQQQYLPHLSAPICNIVVSTSGSSYAMRMADNTVMVLSTSDLIPRTNVSGPSVARDPARLMATISPNMPDQVLLATASDLSPRSQSSSNPSATLLQTFDLRTNHQVARQGLTRNVTSVVNVNPNGRPVVDPNVVQIQASYKGHWLATVDEWTPPEIDREPLYPSVDYSRSLCRTETCLRFWSWKEESKTWEMATRIDEPHSRAPHSVLGLAANPVREQYASAGSDGYVRVWTPMLRLRNGLPIKSSAGESLYTWTCLYEQRPDEVSSSPPDSQAKSAALAYSEDGSAIAVSFVSPAGGPRLLHFVDSRTGYLRESLLHPYQSDDIEMVFSGTRLLFLSDNFLVWDVIHFTRVSNIKLKKPFLENHGRFLAANAYDRTFALALNAKDFQTPATVAIFHADQPAKAIHQSKIHGHARALLPSPKGPGYVVVDGEARFIQLRPSDEARERLKVTSRVEDEVMKGLNDIFGTSKNNDDELVAPTGDASSRFVDAEASRRSGTLEDILEQQRSSSTPLPVSQLFEKVAGLFRRAQ